MSVGPRGALRWTALLVVLLSGAHLPHAAAADAADERAFLSLWSVHQSAPHDHAAVLAACQTLKQTRPASAFGGVADTLAAWHLLKLGRTDAAVTILETLQRRPQEAVAQGAYEVAAGWLTRIDRTRVQQALKFYYRREIGYPSTLAALTDYAPLPATITFRAADRWGLRWDYRLVGYKRLSGLLNQKYTLRSQKLGSGSDLEQALARPYGEQITGRMLRIRSNVPGREVVEMEIALPAAADEGASPRRRKVVGSVNTWTEDLFVAYVGRQFILVCDRSHWKVYPKPGTRR
ncbi:MAG: hypothetical protein HN919_11395 [Verrucomicrobia bacterium]|jgi:hypothetical protein|nr:hypothetical protein [Verrucomicrobiota bacterium]MBT7066900.1 hypothetical protein [Verrucomicrobiota bacterium]MBT7700955.1 hypothetical protein [Verrucomicrobiota bacterium]